MTTWPEDRAPVGTDPSAEGRGCERGAGAGARAISLLRQGYSMPEARPNFGKPIPDDA